jgi:hypothetical protein
MAAIYNLDILFMIAPLYNYKHIISGVGTAPLKPPMAGQAIGQAFTRGLGARGNKRGGRREGAIIVASAPAADETDGDSGREKEPTVPGLARKPSGEGSKA